MADKIRLTHAGITAPMYCEPAAVDYWVNERGWVIDPSDQTPPPPGSQPVTHDELDAFGLADLADVTTTGAAAAKLVAVDVVSPLSFHLIDAPAGGSAATPAALGAGTKQAAKLTTPATPQQLRVVGLGDSVASLKMRWMYPQLNRAFGGGAPGTAVSAGASGTGWSLPGVGQVAATGTITDATTDFDAWFSGLTQRFATGATRTYGIGGVNAYWDTAKVYYVRGPASPDAGTFKIQVDGVDETGFTSVSASNASIALGVATITKGSVAQRGLGVVNLTGAHRIVGVAFYRSDQGGAVYSAIAQGGIALNTALTTGSQATLSAYLADFAPDLVTLEAKESSSYWAATSLQLLNLVKAATPTATIVGIGSTPLATGDADQVTQNTQLRAACTSAGVTYWDGYTPVVNYATLNALGWAGDGTHVDDKASAFLAGLLLRDLGVLGHPGMASGRPVDADSGRVHGRLDLGDVRADGAATSNAAFDTAGGSGFDTTLLVRRQLKVVPSTGTADANSWLLQPDNGATQQIPNGVRVGASGPFLQTSGGTILQVMSARGGGTTRDLQVRSLFPDVQTLNTVSGALTIDLAVASVIVVNLTGNVTSLAFTNQGFGGQEIEVHFQQDATGGRTLAGIAASIKLAGGALTLTTTPSKRDIIRFRQISATYWENSRSLNVG